MPDVVLCDICARRVEPHAHYVVRIEVFADPGIPPVTGDEIQERDYESAMRRLIEEMKKMSEGELQDQVYRRLEFRLCFDCRGQYLANPLGIPREPSGRETTEMPPEGPFVSRAGLKLDHALREFHIDPTGKTCADLGCNAGGFTDCLLQRGAARVYAVDTGYGMLEYKLRKDPRVVTLERTNAMHVSLPEKVSLIVIDVAWTRQSKILPNAQNLLAAGGEIVTLIKPHYEADPSQLTQGVLDEQHLTAVLDRVKSEIESLGLVVLAVTTSPLKGAKGNTELLAHLRPKP